MAMSTDSTHASSGYRMPPEWHRHAQSLTVWPDFDSIGDVEGLKKARAEVSAISNAIARFEPVTMFTRPQNMEQASRSVSGNVTVRPLDASQLWIRDTGPIFVHERNSGCLTGLKLGFNHWGSKLPSTGDEKVAADIQIMAASAMGREGQETWPVLEEKVIPMSDAGFVSEGGAIEIDGQGTLLATKSSIINPNRNPGKSKEEIEEAFSKFFGITKIIWIPGVKDYDITDYHIDAFARFIKKGQVLLSRPSKRAESRAIQAFEEAKEILNRETDCQGNSLDVVEVEEPHRNDLPGEVWEGDMAVASYANYYLVNGGLIMPRFGVGKLDDDAYELFCQYFPDREIVQVDLNTLPKLGGGIHCATQQVPMEADQ
ncbi:hypothetical protein F53441_9316 [Fusarium austroafricanum]|uniref:Agmatine deiminase n=1 Tax=Fusarium austroafricanum TaxID=2364996 RepID=A0A8H4KBW2_9HYPO|nr:hypothetical protein F53441_9316 [Fusarium austroafricanum]